MSSTSASSSPSQSQLLEWSRLSALSSSFDYEKCALQRRIVELEYQLKQKQDSEERWKRHKAALLFGIKTERHKLETLLNAIQFVHQYIDDRPQVDGRIIKELLTQHTQQIDTLHALDSTSPKQKTAETHNVTHIHSTSSTTPPTRPLHPSRSYYHSLPSPLTSASPAYLLSLLQEKLSRDEAKWKAKEKEQLEKQKQFEQLQKEKEALTKRSPFASTFSYVSPTAAANNNHHQLTHASPLLVQASPELTNKVIQVQETTPSASFSFSYSNEDAPTPNTTNNTNTNTMIHVPHQTNGVSANGFSYNYNSISPSNANESTDALALDLSDISLSVSSSNTISSSSSSSSPTTSVIRPARSFRPKVGLRGHLDSVRCLHFDQNPHPTHSQASTSILLLSGGEDGLVQLWSLNNSILMPTSNSKSQISPIYTLRVHSSTVTQVILDSAIGIFSAGLDGNIIHTAFPPLNDPLPQLGTLKQYKHKWSFHTTIWSMKLMQQSEATDMKNKKNSILVAALSDGHIVLIDVTSANPSPVQVKLPVSSVSNTVLIPCSLTSVPQKSEYIIIGCTDGTILLMNILTREVEHTIRAASLTSTTSRLICLHMNDADPSLLVSAHEDGSLHFYTLAISNSSSPIITCPTDPFVLPAHKGIISSVYLSSRDSFTYTDETAALQSSSVPLLCISASHDENVRIWEVNMNESHAMDRVKVKTVLDPHNTHRSKFKEAVHSVLLHPTLPLLASAGADGIIKLYV